ncbi:protein lethal(3)malignant blood neoplasm 1 isoform X1 [Musca domestica]|uniref:Protein lethal(3)malignant blood neoplasm 1 isoform X1 n=1 Tax=Musca domestica TaxID=7370 RepID=A0A9J7D695_MUSDO|nr:protein lethal(3)malignant blood neoplasm 1 isoform X1 [Musca domestica]
MQRLYLSTASVFIAAVCCSFLLPQCSAQSTTVRPYKFGFTIDEQQHRREQRDEKGIVMGEFGFITADGIYHVTVYATDEQGRFRILAMKNYPYESPPKTVDITVKPKPKPSTTTAKPKEDLPHHNFYNEACSGCFLSNGKKEPAKPKGSGETPKTGIRTLSKELPNSSPDKASGTKTTAGAKPSVTGLAKPTTPTKVTQTQAKVPPTPHVKTTEFTKPTTKTKIATTQTKPSKGPTQSNTPKTKPTTTQTKSTGLSKSITPNVIPKPDTPTNSKPQQKKTPTQVAKILPSSNPVAATTVVRKVAAIPSTTQLTPILSTGTNLSNKNTKLAKTPTSEKDIMDLIVNKVLPAAMGGKGVVVKPPGAPSVKNPIESAAKTPSKAGTPTGSGGNSLAPGKGVNANFNPKTTGSSAGPRGGAGSGSGSSANVGGGGDGDLYHFKYLLDYHGHEETGKRNGNKEGNYFAIGDDDVERTIEYVANENGYQPRVNWRKRTDKDNLPKENNLKEYEFVWFYDK